MGFKNLGFFLDPPSIIKNIIHRLAESALGGRLGAEPPAASVRPVVCLGALTQPRSPFLPHHADAREPGPLEKRVHLAHRGQRFDPRRRTGLTRPADKRGRDSGSPISRVQNDAGEQPELSIQRGQMLAGPRPIQAEIARAQRQTRGRGTEDAHADRLGPVPEQHDSADEGEMMGSVMPPSEVRPIGDGAVRKP